MSTYSYLYVYSRLRASRASKECNQRSHEGIPEDRERDSAIAGNVISSMPAGILRASRPDHNKVWRYCDFAQCLHTP